MSDSFVTNPNTLIFILSQQSLLSESFYEYIHKVKEAKYSSGTITAKKTIITKFFSFQY